ncbi:UNVERIFIED_CONTAM: S-methylmethionine permease, partial [Bacillus amyloliquefaciens DSM 7 = ATCC 23350]
ESADTEKTVPRAIKTTVWRLALFFIGTIFVLSGMISIQEAVVIESPFVTVFDRVGVPYAAELMNLVFLWALLSASNSG